jgi:hypothetical protein
MSVPFLSRGFSGKHRLEGPPDRVPPGQYVTSDFPVLSAGPTPHTPLERWSFEINGLVRKPFRWTWDEFQRLPSRSGPNWILNGKGSASIPCLRGQKSIKMHIM